ncbi:hypothetical protein UFOVP449_85 [uncultured Caudovirales phage]|uniref:Cytidyltransferase-like domain-containing protein n=1 Tax=uncultured Caudovirales phage TaxID=2100421 RepID=A0A6J5MCV5_9CAUD|nr:hypothetical protein UFOVP449_85 [uncultured Caudovirales phage]
MNIIKEADKPTVKKTVVVYAGRFQPFHKGHYAAYSKLVSKFGRENVFIGTSSDTSGPKSPFNFDEKKKIATTMFGIPADRFIQIKNPYKPVEILSKFDGQTTQYIAAVGEKDATRLQGKYFKPYNGKAGYGYDEIGYVYPVPAEKDPISGTDVRNYLGGDDEKKAKSFFLKAYPKFDKKIFDMITDKIKSKQMQSLDEYGARTMGNGMSGDFGPNPFSIKDDDVNEEGLPGGAFTGLVSPTGYIGGAPKPKDVKKLSKKLHKGDDTESHSKYVYDPIKEILSNIAAEELFKEFVEGYFGEAEENPIMDKEIEYTRTNGERAKIKVRDALRLKKDHPAHIQAKKMVGTDKPQAAPEKKPEETPTTDKEKKGPEDKKPAIPAAAGDKPKPMTGAALKSDAERTPDEKKQQDLKNEIEKEKKDLSAEDKASLDKMNNPQSPERKGMLSALKKGMNKLVHGAQHVYEHKKEMVVGSFNAVKSLATTGKIGSVKDDKGKSVHWSDFTKKDANGKPQMEDVPVYETDHHGHTKKDKEGNPIQSKDKKGNPKTEKKPVFDDTNPERKELFEKSWKESKNQKKAVKGLAVEAAVLVGSIAVTGGIIGGVGAAAKGAGISGTLSGAAAGVGAKFASAGTFAKYLGKDIIKHCAFEAMGLKTAGAAAGGIALGAAKIFESTDQSVSAKKFMNNYIAKIIEKLKTYKLSDEQTLDALKRYKNEAPSLNAKSAADDLLKEKIDKEHYVPTTGMFNRNLTVQQKIDKLNPARAIQKSKIWHQTFAHHNPETGEIETESAVSRSKVRNIADFVGYSAKRLKLKNKPNVKLILGNTYTEYNASLGGYNPDTKDIYVVVPKRMTADICRTIAHELVHRKQDEMGYIKDRNTAGRTGSPIENQANAIAGILLRDYGKMNKSIYSEGLVLNEVSNIGVGNGSEDRPDGAFLPKGAARRLGAKDGYNNSDKWYTNGGYIQLEFPKADAIFGDEDQNKLTIHYVASNLPRQTGPKTKFTKNPDKVKLISEMGRGDIHFKAVFDYYKNGSARNKQLVAMLVTGNKFAKVKEIVKGLMEMDKDEIEHIENRLGISAFDETKKEVYGGEPGGWYGAGAKRSVDGWIDDGENDYTNLSAITENTVTSTATSDDHTYRIPYLPNWDKFDKHGESHAEIVGYTVLGHTSDHYSQKKKGVVMPSQNPNEENGEGKRWIHPVKGDEYYNDKKIKWELYPLKSRNLKHKFTPPVGNTVDVSTFAKASVIKENIAEWDRLLLEGGAYGHMSHPFDDMDLTFGELRDIITKALDGNLGVVREKTDGQALAISWKNGRLIAARNKSHLANAGANAMGIEDVASKFAGRGGLTDAYNFAMSDLNAAISGLSDKQRDKIFQQGKCFMNLEVIWPTSVNVIPYGQALLIFHNITCYDESGKAIAADQSAARTLAGMIKQINADLQSKYTIQGPPVTSIPKNQNLSSKKGKYLSKLSKLQNQFGLSDSDTVALYHQSWWENFIDEKAPVRVDKLTKEALVKRWAFGDKSFRLNTISNEELVKWAIDTDKVNVAKQQKENIKPFEEIFLGVGADILEFVSSVLTVTPDKAIRAMKDRLKSTADQVRTAGSPAQIQKLKAELERLNNLGGAERIVPVEGLVFFYNGKTYKLTGTFAPLNQILGIFYG